MTTHYIDLKVIHDPETGPTQLLGALYDRLHLALVQQRQDNIGISFPGYSLNPRTLGTSLRLHGSEADLQQLLASDWLKGMRDHVRIENLAVAPIGAPHRIVQRKQFKTSAERLRRRRMRRKGETEEQAKAAIPSSMERHPNLPYIHLHSKSTRQPFCLFIALGPLQTAATPGRFNSHGLSNPASIPWF
ncbi:MAG: type I-F CRISPR-associated endoribonuclease Cas6/Csy4 [Rhodanobacter sp.]|jgi:CRISPR-associated endonuclease Csy4|uniref:type I-F CRISPR-associated endoribonuclease Cas6/Csy4 n=1 Tax=Rhodanobacter sp. KK11 TaxID=3083255 RepID=UPI00296713AA|nr:type I-F CRISPR-associated endoribonuclease Cas6/Csy4 [Rhodanobacter sp. KK11]MDW2983091.1 type I-F CRISPR-associated endoribonuclease Cas6/Csy4 [Rhodanobacter sp. KK11]